MTSNYWRPRVLQRLIRSIRTVLRSKAPLSDLPSKGCATVGILGQLQTPSMRYLIVPALAADGKQVLEIDTSLPDAMRRHLSRCREVIIVRYFSSNWIDDLRAFKAAGGRVIYFMDDDLMDQDATVNLPKKYRKKIFKGATQHRRILEELCDEFWVATSFLERKYAYWCPRLLSPGISVSDLMEVSEVSVCYHGTASHPLELAWIAPVMADVLAKSNSLRFEVFGDIGINRIYRSLPRVSVLHPMAWDNYFSYTRSVRNDIALAPVMPDPFNAARGPTKFFDFVRMGAVGIYSDVEPYSTFIRDGVDGFLLPNDVRVWSEKIVALANERSLREKISRAARERAMSMAQM